MQVQLRSSGHLGSSLCLLPRRLQLYLFGARFLVFRDTHVVSAEVTLKHRPQHVRQCGKTITRRNDGGVTWWAHLKTSLSLHSEGDPSVRDAHNANSHSSSARDPCAGTSASLVSTVGDFATSLATAGATRVLFVAAARMAFPSLSILLSVFAHCAISPFCDISLATSHPHTGIDKITGQRKVGIQL